jgi:tripartite-type tricarboxylate transporter receptor subunit TctC
MFATTTAALRLTLTGAAGGLLLIAAGAAGAQTWPTRPITMVVPFPPGGSTDVAARILATAMSETLGQPVLVENRDGAGGAVGIAYVAAQPADGYTVGVSGVGASILITALGRDTGYNIDTDLQVVGVMGALGLLIAGRSGLEQTNLRAVLDFAAANPDELSYGTSGVGTPGHLAMEYLKSLADIEVLHTPYRGNTPLMNDLLGGHVDLGMLTIPGAPEQVRAGAIQAFAVTSAVRSPLLPDVPTVAELGFEGFSADLWNLLVVPDSTPADAVQALNAALNQAQTTQPVLDAFAPQGLSPTIMSAPEAAQFLIDERNKWRDAVAAAGAAN